MDQMKGECIEGEIPMEELECHCSFNMWKIWLALENVGADNYLHFGG
jgi:hypothetical protein